MTKFVRLLSEAIKASGLTIRDYSDEWGIPSRTVGHWLSGVPPSFRYTAKIEERFHVQGLFELEPIVQGSTNGHLGASMVKIMLARMMIANLVFIFEWLVLEAPTEERKKFREELGLEWEHFMNLARALVNEKSREVIQSEGRLPLRRQ